MALASARLFVSRPRCHCGLFTAILKTYSLTIGLIRIVCFNHYFLISNPQQLSNRHIPRSSSIIIIYVKNLKQQLRERASGLQQRVYSQQFLSLGFLIAIMIFHIELLIFHNVAVCLCDRSNREFRSKTSYRYYVYTIIE